MEKTILFYDGECGFCSRTIHFILKNERNKSMYFASLQSDFTNSFFKERKEKLPDLSSLVVYKNTKFYYKSKAALLVVDELKWIWKIFKLGYLVPKFLRDKWYSYIAKRRNKIVKNYCLVPNEDDKYRFL